jgi:AraC-like DNA-binding protein
MGANTLRARFFAPPASLAGSFTSFYLLEVEPGGAGYVEDLLHPEWGNLRFFLGATPSAEIAGRDSLSATSFIATGPTCCPIEFRMRATRMWGIGLLPLGWAKFMATPAYTLANCLNDGLTHPAYDAFVALHHALRRAPPDDELQAELIRDFFLARDRHVKDAAKIVAAHEALVDPEIRSSSELAERASISTRTLERLCARHFGFSPHLLLRRQRMMRTLSAFMLSDRPTWSQVIDLNYTDHAHFTHEFHAFMRMSPSEYAALDHPVLSSFMAERARVLGSPVQTLDRPAGLKAKAPPG